MKATGEVMSIAENFEAALLKAVRGCETGLLTLNAAPLNDSPVIKRLKEVNDRRLFTVFEALKAGISVDEIFNITKIDRWFLYKLKGLCDFESEISENISFENYLKAKKLGYTDSALKSLTKGALPAHRGCVYKMVDTCGAEFEAVTPYFYSSYDDVCEARSFKRSGKP